MKKSILLGSSVLAMFAMPIVASAQDLPAEASGTLYFESTGWDTDGIIRLFDDAYYNEQKNYPSKEALNAFCVPMDLEFVRSHTRYRDVIKDSTKDVVQDAGFNHDRLLWANLPGGYGKSDGGYPHAEFDQDVYSMWNYTAIFGSWNYSALQAPGAWVDAAHKNGTRIYGGIKFLASSASGGSESATAAYAAFVKERAESGQYTYKHSRSYVNASAFFGNDGINYNQETATWNNADWRDFHAEVMNISRALNIKGYGIGQYTNTATMTASNVGMMMGSASTGIIFDNMLNYSGNMIPSAAGIKTSVEAAEGTGLGCDHLFQGHLLVGLNNDYWNRLNQSDVHKKMNICIWGEHDQSRFFQFRIGTNPTNVQENYQLLLEKAYSGAYRNPLQRPAMKTTDNGTGWGPFQVSDATEAGNQLNNSPGFASMVPERTAIQGNLPFNTFFCLGNGENYFYKGKITHGEWYNMSQQDFVPTYRWLVTTKDNMKQYASNIDVRFTHEDAYIGGSSLRLTGATTSGNDVVLYRTKLTVSAANPKLTVALKLFNKGVPAAGETHLKVILKKENSNTWIEVPTKELAEAGWDCQVLDIAGLNTNDVIEYIGLRVEGTNEDYKMLVGQLQLSDDRVAQQAPIKENSLMVEVKEENRESLSVKMTWEPDYTSFPNNIEQFGMVYNDEIKVDHFEIFVKDSQDGTPREVGRTAQWAAFVGRIPFGQDAKDAWIGVRSVSEDLKCMSSIVWKQIPRSSYNYPETPEVDPYGQSYMGSFGSGSWETIYNGIWVEKVTTSGATKNLTYQVQSNPSVKTTQHIPGVTQYSYAGAEHTLEIAQGQRVTLTVKGHDSGTGECISYDFIYAYIDYDGNYSFLDGELWEVTRDKNNQPVMVPDECIGKCGNLNAGTPDICGGHTGRGTGNGVSFQFTVPSDAHVGPSRLRIVGSDAWMAHPGPVGGTNKGYTVDFPVVITGSEDGQRQPAATYKDYQDKGAAELPENAYREVTEENALGAQLAFPMDAYEATYGEEFTSPKATYKTDGEVTYSSSEPTVAMVNATTGDVTIFKTGETVITAKSTATAKFDADETSYTLTVNKATSTLTFEKETYSIYEGQTLLAVATTNSTAAVAYASTNPDVATVDPVTGLVTSVAPGQTTITATVEATENYTEASAQYSLTVTAKQAAGLTFEAASKTITLGDEFEGFTASGATNGAITYSSSDTSVAEVEAATGKVTVKAIGFTTIIAQSAATVEFNAGMASYSLTVLPVEVVKNPANLTFPQASYTATIGEDFQSPEASGDTDGVISYTSSNVEVATVDSATGEVTLVGVGVTMITATSLETEGYLAGQATYILTVSPKVKEAANLSFEEATYNAYLEPKEGEEFVSPVATGDTDGKITYTSSNSAVATVDAETGEVTLVGEGVTVITATSAETDDYLAGTASYVLVVGLAGVEDVVYEFSAVEIVDQYAYFTATEKAWFYDVNGRVVCYVANAEEPAYVGDIVPGIYLVKMLNDNIIRSVKVAIK